MKLRQLALLVLPDVDDDGPLPGALRGAGLDVLVVHRADAALDALSAALPDVVVVDAELPQVADALIPALPEGTRVVRLGRASGEGAATWVIEPELGLSPPLEPRAVARRVVAAIRPRPPRLEHTALEHGPVRVDVAAHRAFVEGREVVLTSIEFRLLTTLLAAGGRLLSREQLLREVWGVSARTTTRTIDTHVKRLRGKLGPARDVIETVRSSGWRMHALPEPAGARATARQRAPRMR